MAILAVGAAWAGEEKMAEIVPRADDVSLNLTIENIDGKVVNVPEAHIRKITPGDHYLGVKIDVRSVSGGSLISGLGVFSAFSGALSDTPPIHDGVSFTAQPGIRYLLNGAMVDGKPKIWVEEESYESTRDDDMR
ncbi:MAG: hypothetical protein E2O65_01610 [Gammaproteobacteria bacterium]|nr:MAG: hypothetical protein E2O65_01610 [Gammaproteobacteria bacterium]